MSARPSASLADRPRRHRRPRCIPADLPESFAARVPLTLLEQQEAAARRDPRIYDRRTLARVGLPGGPRQMPRVLPGEVYRDARPAPVRVPLRTPLTSRERYIVAMLAEGYTAVEVAAFIGIAHPTVLDHMSNASKKVPGDLQGRDRLVAWYRGATLFQLTGKLAHDIGDADLRKIDPIVVRDCIRQTIIPASVGDGEPDAQASIVAQRPVEDGDHAALPTDGITEDDADPAADAGAQGDDA